MKILARMYSNLFFAGKSPLAPGTIGSLAAAAPVYLIIKDMEITPALNIIMVILTLIITVTGTYTADITAKMLNKPDPSEVIIDEVAGQLLSLLFIPAYIVNSGSTHFLIYCLTGFALFRIFDINKPYPVCWADENVPGGKGIMLDDIFAGIYSLIIMQIIYRLVLPEFIAF